METKGATSRRTLVRGAAWSVPVMAVSAPAAYAGPSQCQVVGSVQLGPRVYVDVRAVCVSTAQSPSNATTIRQRYGRGYLPAYLEICNCTNTTQWSRWQETDTLSNFQIEVDGVHNDQNGPGGGFRPPFQLPRVGDQGGCKRFNLTYRTSATRPYSPSQTSVPANAAAENITYVLQTAPSQTGPWTTTQTFNFTGGAVWRTVGSAGNDPINFNSCSPQVAGAAPSARSTTDTEEPPSPSGSGD